MYGKDVHRRWFWFKPGVVYEAKQVTSSYLVIDHPEHPGRDVYLRLSSPWLRQRVTFTPDTLDLSFL